MRRWLTAMAEISAIVSCLIVPAWLLSRTITDRWRWSQYPWWLPTWAWGAVAVAFLACSLWDRRHCRRLRRAGLVGLLGLTLYFALVECRIYRLIGREPIQRAAARSGGWRVLFWNPSAAPASDVASHLALVPADLAVIVNPPYD